mmetsp:Transcript_50251/g.119957  ORF Transcript_50251/g.119957 Transcript_50251/m.119957 type:complete len:267 (-) Transcript_50251:338-1138(-)
MARGLQRRRRGEWPGEVHQCSRDGAGGVPGRRWEGGGVRCLLPSHGRSPGLWWSGGWQQHPVPFPWLGLRPTWTMPAHSVHHTAHRGDSQKCPDTCLRDSRGPRPHFHLVRCRRTTSAVGDGGRKRSRRLPGSWRQLRCRHAPYRIPSTLLRNAHEQCGPLSLPDIARSVANTRIRLDDQGHSLDKDDIWRRGALRQGGEARPSHPFQGEDHGDVLVWQEALAASLLGVHRRNDRHHRDLRGSHHDALSFGDTPRDDPAGEDDLAH